MPAHLIRNADEVAAVLQRQPGRGELYGQRVAQVFRDGIRLHQDVTKGVCTREEYAQQGEFLTLRLDALLNRAPLKSKANERLRLGLLKQSVLDRLWRFLKDPDTPPTNNAAERSLRTVVMARKVSQCSKNGVGAQTYMRIKSTVETARLRGQGPVAVLAGLMR
ncbi:transposase [Deinococcus caeni]|uniref:Transposase IS66 central domain-containing protein n=1 Tax=Deinococcus caeni TaxID=569127 RepID=A0ABP9ULY4_9DEIO